MNKKFDLSNIKPWTRVESLFRTSLTDSLAWCHLPSRTHSALLTAGYKWLGDFANLSREELLSIPGIGPSGVKAVDGFITGFLGHKRGDVDSEFTSWRLEEIKRIETASIEEGSLTDSDRFLRSPILSAKCFPRAIGKAIEKFGECRALGYGPFKTKPLGQEAHLFFVGDLLAVPLQDFKVFWNHKKRQLDTIITAFTTNGFTIGSPDPGFIDWKERIEYESALDSRLRYGTHSYDEPEYGFRFLTPDELKTRDLNPIRRIQVKIK